MNSSLFTFVKSLTPHQISLLTLFILLKLFLIFMLPLTGDEAYFIVWGQTPSLGYYDHPPAVGWVLALMAMVADDLVWYRSFAFISAAIIGVLLYRLVMLDTNHQRAQHNQIEKQKNLAIWVALAFFISPLSLMFVVTANDTVLVLFSMLGVYFFAKNLQHHQWSDAFWTGVFLGLAFLSKYFAAFMLLGLLAFSLKNWAQIHKPQFGLMLALVLIAIAENLYFNATHCWNNILFNFFSRTKEAEFEPANLFNFLLMIAVMLSPFGLWQWFKNRMNSNQKKSLSQSRHGIDVVHLAVYASTPLLFVLAFVSLNNPIGLHWPLIAVTLLSVMYLTLNKTQLMKLYLFNGYFSLLIGGALLVALFNINHVVSDAQKPRVSVYTEPTNVCALLPKDEMLFTLDYSSQSTLSYHCKNDDIHVFASTSKYGREDDKHTNFKNLAGESLKILVTKKKELAKVTPYFDTTDISELILDNGVTYYLAEGQNFDYAQYRQKVLLPVSERFYTPPNWLKSLSISNAESDPESGSASVCGFKSKYDLP